MCAAKSNPVEEARGLVEQARAARSRRDLRGAAGLYERALGLVAGAHDVRRELALTLGIVGERDRAVVEMRAAVEARPDEPRWHFDLGELLVLAGEAEAAPECFERAAALDPGSALYPARLSALCWRLRRREEALEWAELALAIDPGQEMARLTLARAHFAAGELDDAGVIAAGLVGEGGGAGAMKAMVIAGHHLLGEVRERQERWDEAFAAHRGGNELSLDTPAAAASLRVPLERQLEGWVGEGVGEVYGRWGRVRFDDGIAEPLIVTGFPRCGTTMVEQMFAAHARMTSADERPLYLDVRRRLAGAAGTLKGLDGLSMEEVGDCRGLVGRALEGSVGESERGLLIVDKHPVRTLDLPLVNRLFPGGRVVFMLRDPRDVVLSAYFQHFEVNPAMVRFLRLEDAARWYVAVMGFWRAFREVTSLEWVEVRYEDLVEDFETGARGLIEFAGEEWDENVVRFHERAGERVVLSASSEQVTEGVHGRSVGRWRRYEREMEPVFGVLRPLVEALGYSE